MFVDNVIANAVIATVGSIPLNDTGITACGNASTNGLACPQAGFPGQDAEFGCDVTHNDPSDGHAGFSFTKLDANGNPLPVSATVWSCVRDNVTGRIWEVKTDDGGLRDKDWTYTWYNPDPTTNGGNAGTQNGGSCVGSACDTLGFVQAVNAQGLCGANDWRMPDPRELMSIVRNDRYGRTIDTDWFLHVEGASGRGYWSSSPSAYSTSTAWGVSFNFGFVVYRNKGGGEYVRLVRAGQ